MTPDRWKEIDRLYQASVSLPPVQRARFLADSCVDPDIRREVESLLAQRENLPSFLERRGLDVAAGIMPQNEPGTLVGRTIDHYEVRAFIGAGGMGEVYRARDSRLGRDVALKVLPAEFSKDPERLRRSEREAKLLASLNHPNIAAIYDLEESDDLRCLVLEFVEGQTLTERLKQGRMAMPEALEIARQIADALEAAHENGIVHRDLKPPNVMIMATGKVKVLDFGIAKMLEPDALPAVPVTADALTRDMVLGTASYMSPEQARGKAADRRSDIWAFGCVLYELLTGRRAFQGETITDTLAAVVEREPDFKAMPSTTPAKVHDLLRRCLQKDARRRLQAIGDARLELEELLNGSSPASPAAQSVPSKGRPVWVVSGLGLLVLAAMLAATMWTLRPVPAPPASEMRVEINTPPTLSPRSLEISPDGRKIAFVANSEGRPRLWVHSLDSGSAQPLSNTDHAEAPFWSPDSRSLGFFAENKLKRIEIEGGYVQELTNALGIGGSWSSGGVIILNVRGGIQGIPAAGGRSEPASSLPPGPKVFPRFLPDGRHFLYYVSGGPDVRGVYIGQLDRPESERLLNADSSAVYAPSGHLLFIRQATLFAQQFDPIRLELSGDPFPVAENVSAGADGEPPMSVSATGTIIYRSGSVGSVRRQFVWLDRSGNEIGKVGDPMDEAGHPSLSPDGGRVALARTVAGNSDIWFLEIARGMLTPFTFHGANDTYPVWSPDSSHIAFCSTRIGQFPIYLKAVTGGEEVLLAGTPDGGLGPLCPTDWSKADFIIGRSSEQKNGFDIWALKVTGDRQPFLVVQTEFDEYNAQFSPNGKWIAYQSNASRRFEIYAQPFRGPGEKVTAKTTTISTNGGAQIRWNPNGKELFYIALDRRLMAVPIEFADNDQTIKPGAPVPLFPTRVGPPVDGRAMAQYMISADGQRFLMKTLVEEATSSPITVILNWKPKS